MSFNRTADEWKNRQNPLPFARTPQEPRKMNMMQTTRNPTSILPNSCPLFISKVIGIIGCGVCVTIQLFMEPLKFIECKLTYLTPFYFEEIKNELKVGNLKWFWVYASFIPYFGKPYIYKKPHDYCLT